MLILKSIIKAFLISAEKIGKSEIDKFLIKNVKQYIYSEYININGLKSGYNSCEDPEDNRKQTVVVDKLLLFPEIFCHLYN